MKKGSFVNTQPLLHLWRARPSRDPARDSHCVRLDPCVCVHLCPAADSCSFYSSHPGQPRLSAWSFPPEDVQDLLKVGGGKPVVENAGNTMQVTLQKVVFRVEEPFEGIEDRYVEVTHP